MKTKLIFLSLLFPFCITAQTISDCQEYLRSNQEQFFKLNQRGTTYQLDSSYTGAVFSDGLIYEFFSRKYYSYGPNDDLIKTKTQQFNELSIEFEDYRQELITNNVAGQPISVLLQEYEGTIVGWQNLSLLTIAYNSEGLIREQQVDSWNVVDEVWEQNFTISNSYELDNDSRIVLRTDSIEIDGTVQAFLRTTFTYEGNQLEEEFSEAWINGQWQPSAKEVYDYLDTNQFEVTTSYWDSGQESFRPVFRKTNNIHALIGEVVFLLEETWNSNTETWDTLQGTQFAYSALNTTAIKEISGQIDFCIIPNPIGIGDEIQCTFPQDGKSVLRLLDMQGREVGRSSDQTSFRIPTKISSGMYMLQWLENGQTKASQRIIVIE